MTGIDTLSSQDQQVLIDKMADAVQYIGNAELMRAVVDMGEDGPTAIRNSSPSSPPECVL